MEKEIMKPEHIAEIKLPKGSAVMDCFLLERNEYEWLLFMYENEISALGQEEKIDSIHEVVSEGKLKIYMVEKSKTA